MKIGGLKLGVCGNAQNVEINHIRSDDGKIGLAVR